MFDGKIDFMDFNKIKINYGGKLTCRKIFKKKYIIFLILSILLLIILIYIYSVKNSKISGILIEIKELEDEKNKIENSLNLLTTQNMEEDINYNKFKSQVDLMEKDIEKKIEEKKEIENQNSQIISERDTLERRSTSLSMQLKTEMELKEVHEQKKTSLNTLLESLKKEYEKLLEQKGDKKEDKEDNINIESSKIINSIEALSIERKIKGKIGNKCFDGKEDKFSPEIFHKKCDKSALLVLIKTDNNERVGALTKESFEGLEIKRDPSSAIFNVDQGKFYVLASPEYSTIVCDPDELPQFGVDLKIKTDGQGINSFPFNYGDKNLNTYEDLTENDVFKIEHLEIYKLDL